jgi:hypothetical protein
MDGNTTADLWMFFIANFVNLLITAIFVFRVNGNEKTEYFLGLIVITMVLPILGIVIQNILQQRIIWKIVLPIPLILYCLTELLFDYILNLDFRNTWLLWPYVVIFYAGSWGMIGYSFLMGKIYGFITLGTYFMNLFAAWYAHSR